MNEPVQIPKAKAQRKDKVELESRSFRDGMSISTEI
jgi:hypothetical protein